MTDLRFKQFGSVLAMLLTFGSLSVSIVDYYMWRSAPLLLSRASGFLITISYLINLLYLSVIGNSIDKEDDINSSIVSFINFLLLLGVVPGVGFFMLAIGEFWGLFTFWVFQFFVMVLQLSLSVRSSRSDYPEIPLFNTFRKVAKPFMKLVNPLLVLVIFLLYVCGGILVHAQLTGGDRILGQVTGAAAGITSGFIILWMISITLYTIQYFTLKNKRAVFYGLIIIALIMSSVFLLPLINKPRIIRETDAQFESEFGPNWRSIPSSLTSYVLSEPFIESQFYYGYSDDRLADPEHIYYQESLNNLYFNHQDFQLHYDVRYPKPGFAGPNSIGKNSTIILLHSGGWTGGDKSLDAVQVQKHLAGQGYVIFDIQYRLLDPTFLDTKSEFGFDITLGAPVRTEFNNVHGMYSIRDMIQDFGTFTKYLAGLSESERHYANLDSVIIMGVSAGGHIGAICTYGYSHPYFAGNFSNALTIKAGVFYNPPNDANFFFYEGHPMHYPLLIKGSPEELPDQYFHYTPSNLINESSVPTILFHGTIDKMVPPENSEQLYMALQTNTITSVLIRGHYGGHGFDFCPSFSPITTYYLERFLYHTVST